MRKELFVIGFSLIVIVSFFSGCQESEIEAASFEGITLESSIVELASASLNYYYNSNNEVDKVEVKYLFHNIADRTISIQIYAEFYDTNGNLLTKQGPKIINFMPPDHTEQASAGFNVFSYEGDDVDLVDHVIIIVEETKIT
jgi:hypothetical protein